MLLVLILAIVAISAVTRLIAFPFRLGRRVHPFYGYGNPYGYYGCHCGYRRRGGLGRLILAIVVLVALSHLFGHHHHRYFL